MRTLSRLAAVLATVISAERLVAACAPEPPPPGSLRAIQYEPGQPTYAQYVQVVFEARTDGIQPYDECSETAWDFGDGATAQAPAEQRVFHEYATPGTFTVTATITNAHGSRVLSNQITIERYPMRIFVRAPSVSEQAPSATINLRRDVGLNYTVGARLTVGSDDPTAAVPRFQTSVVFQPNETTKDIIVPLRDNNLYDSKHVLYPIVLDQFVGDVITAPPPPYLVVNDNETAPTLTVGDVRVSEGDTGVTVAEIPLRLSGPMSGAFSPEVFFTTDGTLGTDFQQPERPVIAAGAVEGTLYLRIIGDQTPEQDEGVYLAVTWNSHPEPKPAGLEARGTAVIVNDDDATSIPPTLGPAVVRQEPGTTVTLELDARRPFTSATALAVSSSHPNVVSVPNSVVAPAGASKVAFNASILGEGNATISVALPPSHNNVVLQANIIGDLPLRINASTHAIEVREGATAEIELTAEGSAGRVRVLLHLSDPSLADVPESLSITEGRSTKLTVRGKQRGSGFIRVAATDGEELFQIAVPIEVTPAAARRRAVRSGQ